MGRVREEDRKAAAELKRECRNNVRKKGLRRDGEERQRRIKLSWRIIQRSRWYLLGFIAEGEGETEDTGWVTVQRAIRGGHRDEVVIKKCEIWTSELSAVSWGIYLRRAGKERRRREGCSEQGGSLLTVRSIDFSLLLYLIAQADSRWFGFSLAVCVCVNIL